MGRGNCNKNGIVNKKWKSSIFILIKPCIRYGFDMYYQIGQQVNSLVKQNLWCHSLEQPYLRLRQAESLAQFKRLLKRRHGICGRQLFYLFFSRQEMY